MPGGPFILADAVRRSGIAAADDTPAPSPGAPRAEPRSIWEGDLTPLHAVLERLAGTTAVAAGRNEGRRYGVPVYSVAALSLHPPRVLFCASKAEAGHEDLLGGDRVTLCISSGGEDGRTHLVLAGRTHNRICAGESTLFVLDVGRARTASIRRLPARRTC